MCGARFADFISFFLVSLHRIFKNRMNGGGGGGGGARGGLETPLPGSATEPVPICSNKEVILSFDN